MLLVKKLFPDAMLPTIAKVGEDLGYDLYAYEETVLRPGEVNVVKTGISARYVDGSVANYGLIYHDRSGLGYSGIHVFGGVIDAGYTGELMVLLYNATKIERLVKAGDRVVQAIPMRVTADTVQEVAELPASSRGAAGFGSTGR